MKFIIINGPCGVGKSSLANTLHKERPLSFLFDSYAQIRCISQYERFGEERWEMTVEIAAAVIDAMLRLGRDVILDMMIYSPEVLERFCGMAKAYDAQIDEFMLCAPKEVVISRAQKRGRHDNPLSEEKVASIWDRMEGVKAYRTKAHLIDTDNRSTEEVYAQVNNLLK